MSSILLRSFSQFCIFSLCGTGPIVLSVLMYVYLFIYLSEIRRRLVGTDVVFNKDDFINRKLSARVCFVA